MSVVKRRRVVLGSRKTVERTIATKSIRAQFDLDVDPIEDFSDEESESIVSAVVATAA